MPSWNPDETGLENIKFNLLIQGVDPREIPEKIDDIVDFTDLGPFIYQPLKTYSTGMSARLAFAIATAIDPEILILDEVLGAGDGYFAGRAARRMQTMCDRGKALLFVSHATAAVRMICDTCIWLENGQVRLRGPVETVVRQYEEDILRQQDETLREGNRCRLQAQHRLRSRIVAALTYPIIMVAIGTIVVSVLLGFVVHYAGTDLLAPFCALLAIVL